MSDAIIVEGLIKKFRATVAVNGITFAVREGECFGMLGPNGAGKTTTVNMLTTLLKPTSGKAIVAGYDVTRQRNEVRSSIGVVFQEPALDSKLTGRENLEFHSMMYGLAPSVYRPKIDELLELVELTAKANTLTQNYSGGMKRRLEIARGLIHSPKVLFLDEPTLGLDAQTRRLMWEYIKKLNKKHDVTVILNTHYMEEADFLCDRIAIIDHGSIKAIDTPDRLKEDQGGDIVTIEIEGEHSGLVSQLNNELWVKSVKEYDECLKCLSISVERAEIRIPQILGLANMNKLKVLSVNIHKPSLEDVFLKYTGKTIRNIEERERIF